MTKIVQFSDVHWRGITRHEEYTNAFNNFFSQLREEVKPDYIIGTGDFFHTKTTGITPEVIDKMTWMFRELAEIAPLYLILGNHDGNLTNENRQDTISPIIAAMNNKNITLFKQSVNHTIPNTNINLCVLSCFDKDGWQSVSPKQDMVNVALFHGSVTGCEVDSDWVMSNGEVDRSMFEKYHFAMLGDIHRCQFLGHRPHSGITRDLKPWIGYPGSFIQQNYGEIKTKGYLVWDIRSDNDWDVSFKDIPNEYSFNTVPWMGSVQETVDSAIEVCNGDLLNKRIRIVSNEKIFDVQIKELHQKLKSSLKASEVVIKADVATNISELDIAGGIQKISLRNDPNTLFELYDNFIVRDYKSTLSEDQKIKAKDYIKASLEKVRSSEEDSVRDVSWTIKKLEFNNLYRYGENNVIDFEKIRGITGIFGNNRLGKSSIVGALMFGLYNTTDRGPVKSAYIINKNKTAGSSSVTIEVSGVEYVIERKVEKAKKRGGIFDEEKAATTLKLSKVNKDGSREELINENSDTRTDTDKVIRKLIGNSQDFLLTAFSNQGGMNKFIDEGATQRKSILNRFLDLDIFEKLNKMASEELSGYNAKIKKFQNVDWDHAAKLLEEAVQSKQDNITTLKTELEEVKTSRENLLMFLQQRGIVKLNNIQKTLEKSNRAVEDIERKLSLAAAEKITVEQKRNIFENNLKQYQEQIKLLSVDDLKAKKELLQTIGKQYHETKARLGAEKQKLDSQVKSIRKLDLVPCGTSFQSCHYIKDSHEDKSLHETQKEEVLKLIASFDGVREEYETLQNEKIEEGIQKHNELQLTIQSNSIKLEATIKQIEQINSSIESLTNTLDVSKKEQDKLKIELESFGTKSFNEKIEEEKELARKISQLETQLQTIYQNIGADKNKLEHLNAEAAEAKEIIEEQRVYDSIVQAFSKNGIPAFILKSQLPAINAELNNILAGIVPFRIFLETEVGSNTLDVFIEDKDSRRVIELASGMEKMIASVAIRVALISLSSLPKPDIFIQDEGMGVIDGNNISKVIELLNTIKNRFKAILIITHVDEIKEAASTILSIHDNGSESFISN